MKDKKEIIKYRTEFNKNNYQDFKIRIKRQESELIDFLKSKKSINAYIINLIKEDYKKSQQR